jgi:hypothetical protein
MSALISSYFNCCFGGSVSSLLFQSSLSVTGPTKVTFIIYHSVQKVVSESSRPVILLTASVKEDERGGQGQTFTSLVHQSAT